MSTTVDDETLASFMSVLDGTVTRDQAIHILKLSNNSLEAAIDKYFSSGGSDGLQSLLNQPINASWDNSAFGADRYGKNDAGSIPTFNIDYAPGFEHYPHSGGPSGAPTRPSSRTSHRSNVSTHAGDAPRQSVETGQESGVVGGTAFGPASKEQYYDNESWAMVPLAQSTEYVPDAFLWCQSRNTHEPAFLKPSTGSDYLPALLTILHSIPLYRNALLSPNIQIDNYWSGNEWWKGNSENPPRMTDGSSNTASSSELELIYETQRLMAFLDGTERSYASLDTLFRLETWKQPNFSSDEPTNDDMVKFLVRWSQVYKQHHPDVELDGVFRSTINIGRSLQRSFVLDVDVPVVSTGEFSDRHLYDVLDAALFDSPIQRAHITKASDVLIFRLNSAMDKLDCTIPPVLHADRYLEENKALVEDMFAQKKQLEESMIQADDKLDRLKFHRPKKSDLPAKVNALDMIKASMTAFDPEVAGNQDDPNDAATLAQLKSLYESVERELSNLEKEKQKACDALLEVSNSFRAPLSQVDPSEEDDSSRSSKHTYKLQGVATSSTDYYVLHPKADSQDPDSLLSPQWWHIKYDYDNSDDATITRSKTTIEGVCADASVSSGKVLLVYANTAALSIDNLALPTPLHDFVQADNAVFVEDIESRNNNWDDQNTTWVDHNPQEGVNVIGSWATPEGTYDTPSDNHKTTADWAMDSDIPRDPPSYNDEDDAWNSISASHIHQGGKYKGVGNGTATTTTTGGGGGSQDADSAMSSTTLTPNTDVDDDVDVDVDADMQIVHSDMVEMTEVNGGIAAWAGAAAPSNASSETVGTEPMDIAESGGGGGGHAVIRDKGAVTAAAAIAAAASAGTTSVAPPRGPAKVQAQGDGKARDAGVGGDDKAGREGADVHMEDVDAETAQEKTAIPAAAAAAAAKPDPTPSSSSSSSSQPPALSSISAAVVDGERKGG